MKKNFSSTTIFMTSLLHLSSTSETQQKASENAKTYKTQDFPFKKCPKYLNSKSIQLLLSWIFEFPSIMSESELSSYQLQLQQVEAALTSDPANSELLKLKADLEQVIDLTKELVAQSVAKAGGHREEEEEEEEEPGWMTS